MKVISLIRVSTAAQSLDSQSEKVKDFILKDGYHESDIIPIEYIESGTKLSEEERQGLSKMKWHIEHEQVDAVYAYEISRISRKVSIVYSIRDYLIAHKVNLIILNPYFRLLNDDGTLSTNESIMFGIFASLAEQETYLRVERITRGKEKKAAEGKLSQGYPIFGYTVDSDHYIIPHPQEAPIVREIFERYANLETSGSIGKDLWLRGCLCAKTDKLISHQTKVCGIIREKRYAFIDGPYRCPLISKELWDKVQAIHAEQPEHFIRKSRTIGCYPLQGYIYTRQGYKMSPSITNNRYLKLDGYHEPMSINMKAAHGLSFIIINRYLQSGVLEVDRQAQYNEAIDLRDKTKIKLSTIDSKIDSLKAENEMINRRIIKGRISESKGDEMIDSNAREINALEDTRQELTYNLSVLNNKLILLSNPLLLEDASTECKTLPELKDAVQKYISKIVVYKLGFSRYKLEYHFNDGSVRIGCFYSDKRKIWYYDNPDDTVEEITKKEKQLNNHC